MFPEIPVFFKNNYLEIFSKYLEKVHFINNMTLWVYTSASWLWINIVNAEELFLCKKWGIARNHICLDSLPYKYPYFSPFV